MVPKSNILNKKGLIAYCFLEIISSLSYTSILFMPLCLFMPVSFLFSIRNFIFKTFRIRDWPHWTNMYETYHRWGSAACCCKCLWLSRAMSAHHIVRSPPTQLELVIMGYWTCLSYLMLASIHSHKSVVGTHAQASWWSHYYSAARISIVNTTLIHVFIEFTLKALSVCYLPGLLWTFGNQAWFWKVLVCWDDQLLFLFLRMLALMNMKWVEIVKSNSNVFAFILVVFS